MTKDFHIDDRTQGEVDDDNKFELREENEIVSIGDENEMNWDNLKNKRCPKCGGKLRNNNLYLRHAKKYQKDTGCKFIISKIRWKEIINSN